MHVFVKAIPAALQQPKGYANVPRQTVSDYDIVTRTFVQTDFSKFGNFLGQALSAFAMIGHVRQDHPLAGAVHDLGVVVHGEEARHDAAFVPGELEHRDRVAGRVARAERLERDRDGPRRPVRPGEISKGVTRRRGSGMGP